MFILIKLIIVVLLLFLITANAFPYEIDINTPQNEDEAQTFFLLPFGYDFVRLDNQSVHLPVGGFGYMSGEQNLPFDEVESRILGLALYRPIIFSESFYPDTDKLIHQIDLLFDWRIRRHQLLMLFKSSADRPIAGGLSTVNSGIGWGYEIIRRPQVSLILGAALCVTDFGITMPNGSPWPVLPLPLIRFGIDMQWFASSFDFISGPNLEIAIAPKERIRFTADMRMDHYRSLYDIIYECTLWYRLFDESHQLGDFAGIGIGVKNESVAFSITKLSNIESKDFEFQYNSIFAVVDISILKLQGGWVFDSRYFVDGEKTGMTTGGHTGSPGRGFFLSIQGIIPFGR